MSKHEQLKLPFDEFEESYFVPEEPTICPECQNVMECHTEQRDGGYEEIICECKCCGYMESS